MRSFSSGRRVVLTGRGGLNSGGCAKVKNCQNGVGRNCCQVFTNTSRNCMKLRYLTIENVGRKYVKIFAYGIAVSEKITTFATQ